jgi:hypothetical protein
LLRPNLGIDFLRSGNIRLARRHGAGGAESRPSKLLSPGRNFPFKTKGSTLGVSIRAFLSEVDTGSREENASEQSSNRQNRPDDA